MLSMLLRLFWHLFVSPPHYSTIIAHILGLGKHFRREFMLGTQAALRPWQVFIKPPILLYFL